MIREFDRKLLATKYNGDLTAMERDEYFGDWTLERIKGAFNRGQGTEKHLREYMKNNKAYAIFKEV